MQKVIRNLKKIKAQKGVVIKEIQRNKGLGEMSPEAFKYVLNREDYTKITIDHLDKSKHMLHTCFGKDTQLRKDLLLDEESQARAALEPQTKPVTSSVAKKVVKKVAKKIVKKTVKKVAKKTVKKTIKKVTKKASKKKVTKRK